MKVSALVKSLQYMQETYGDLLVNISVDTPSTEVISSNEIFIRYEQYPKEGEVEKHDEVSISSFPY